ncbi:hypothetical protein M0R45_031257 [Rubus argutus]|uniref:Uncharacterized protein n=1 Tax=Rubus argutus TaxID=59490 RepID=A0AAW1WFV0_RUBAR
MAADEVPLLNLFDSLLFEHANFQHPNPMRSKNDPVSPPTGPRRKINSMEPNPSGLPTLIVRALSGSFLDTKSSLFLRFELLSTLGPRHLYTKAFKQSPPVKNKRVLHRERSKRRQRSGSSKSLSDLEFDELKGFMDLGFVFTEDDNKDLKLVSIIPGLQRLGISSEGGEQDRDDEEKRVDGIHEYSHVVSRPYLSEAWEALEYQRKEDQLMNWRIPADLGENMKHHLKFWAHTVASTVR